MVSASEIEETYRRELDKFYRTKNQWCLLVCFIHIAEYCSYPDAWMSHLKALHQAETV